MREPIKRTLMFAPVAEDERSYYTLLPLDEALCVKPGMKCAKCERRMQHVPTWKLVLEVTLLEGGDVYDFEVLCKKCADALVEGSARWKECKLEVGVEDLSSNPTAKKRHGACVIRKEDEDQKHDDALKDKDNQEELP